MPHYAQCDNGFHRSLESRWDRKSRRKYFNLIWDFHELSFATVIMRNDRRSGPLSRQRALWTLDFHGKRAEAGGNARSAVQLYYKALNSCPRHQSQICRFHHQGWQIGAICYQPIASGSGRP